MTSNNVRGRGNYRGRRSSDDFNGFRDEPYHSAIPGRGNQRGRDFPPRGPQGRGNASHNRQAEPRGGDFDAFSTSDKRFQQSGPRRDYGDHGGRDDGFRRGQSGVSAGGRGSHGGDAFGRGRGRGGSIRMNFGRGGRDDQLALPCPGSISSLRSNTRQLTVNPSAPPVYLYDVKISAITTLLTSTKERLLQRELYQRFGTAPYPYDGENKLYSTRADLSFSDHVDGRQYGLKDDTVEVEVTLCKGKVLNLRELLEKSTIESDGGQELEAALAQILDLAAKHKSHWVQGKAYGRNDPHFIINWRKQIAQNPLIQLHACHVHSVNLVQAPGRRSPILGVTVDMIGRLRVKEGRFSDHLKQMKLTLEPGCRNGVVDQVTRLVKNLRMEVRHRSYLANVKIKEVSHKTALTATLDVTGETLADFYKTKYNVTLKHPDWRLLRSERREELYPAELLFVPEQSWSNKLKHLWQNEVPRLLTMKPEDREGRIRQLAEAAFANNPVLDWFGIDVTPEALTVEASILQPPIVAYSNESKMVANGEWNMVGVQFLQPAQGKRLALVNLTHYHVSRCFKFFEALHDQAKRAGVEYAPLRRENYFDLHHPKEMAQIVGNLRGQVELVIVLLPSQEEDLYNSLKSQLDYYVVSQMVVADKTPYLGLPGGPQAAKHFGNLLLKINAKLGGKNSTLDHQRLSVKSFDNLSINANTVILGADLRHPKGKTRVHGVEFKMPSFAALVSTCDRDCAKYLYSLRAQHGGPDVMTHIEEQFTECMERRGTVTGRPWPKEVIYLRDGFSDTGIDSIRDEVTAIKHAYRRRGYNYEPSVLGIAVRKRQKNRFFPKNGGNAVPGTIVLDDLSTPSRYPNFFLLSHRGIIGTSVPTKYMVVHDDVKEKLPALKGMDKRHLSEFYGNFLYHMCALFPRATKLVGYPAPVYEAHCLAKRGARLAQQMETRMVLYPPPSSGCPKQIIIERLTEMAEDNIQIANKQFAKLPLNFTWI